MESCDVLIIGGGITGTAIARELSRYDIDVILLEGKKDIGIGTTKGNGGVVHAGYDPSPNTLKGKLNSKGCLMYPKLNEELNFGYKNTGSLVVGFTKDDLFYLEQLHKKGIENNVPGIKILKKHEIKVVEPNISDNANYALYAPSAGIVDPFSVALAFAENALLNGVKIYLDQKVIDINKENEEFYIKTASSSFKSKYIINAAGVYGDSICEMVGIRDYRIKPRLGELLILDKALDISLNTIIFPIPEKDTKGIVVLPTLAGNILVGSTAVMTEDKEAVTNSSLGIASLIKGANKMIPQINEKVVIREFAGLRPVVLDSNNDFIIEASKKVRGFINAIGIQSPGVASAPSVALFIRDILYDLGLDLKEKSTFNPYREAIIDFSELSLSQKEKLIKSNKQYGNVICKCELVTEGEIVESIKGPIGARTIDGVKRRTRAGMGRCQGGFCQHKILSILSRELNIPPSQVLKENENSNVVFGNIKGREE